jgi:hypothetical protein
MSKIIGYEDATIGMVYVTAKRKYHVYEEEGKVHVEAILNEGESAQTLGFVPECDDRYYFGEYESYEEATKTIEED